MDRATPDSRALQCTASDVIGTPRSRNASDGGSGKAAAQSRPRPRNVMFLTCAYVTTLVLYMIVFGVPTGTVPVMLWIMGALSIAAVAMPDRRIVRVFLDWLPFMLVLLAWEWSRGLAVRLNRPIQVTLPIEIDRVIGFGHVPTVWLQEKLGIQNGDTHVWEIAPTLIYITHFIATPVVAAVLWVKSREYWLVFVKRFISLMVAGVITYVIVPWAPPWRASYFGELPAVHRSSGDGWQYLHLDVAGDMLSVGQAAVNLDAAMPSLHAGLSLLVVLFLWRFAKPVWRVILGAYVVGMAFTLILGGEHYVNDVLAGWVYAIAVHLIWNWIERRRRQNIHSRPTPAKRLRTGVATREKATRPCSTAGGQSELA